MPIVAEAVRAAAARALGLPEAAVRDVYVLVDRPGTIVARAVAAGAAVVVRLHDAPGHVATTVATHARFTAAGLPCAPVLGRDEGPPESLVLGWIDGTAITTDSPACVWRELGRLLQIVHSLPIGANASIESPVAYAEGWLRTVLDWWETTGRSDGDRTSQARAWLEELRPQLTARPVTTTLYDGHPEHILTDGTTITGLIDLEIVSVCDPVMDFAMLEMGAPGRLADVLAGYGATDDEIAAVATLVPFYVLLRALSRMQWAREIGDTTESAAYLNLIDAVRMGAVLDVSRSTSRRQ